MQQILRILLMPITGFETVALLTLRLDMTAMEGGRLVPLVSAVINLRVFINCRRDLRLSRANVHHAWMVDAWMVIARIVCLCLEGSQLCSNGTS